MSQNEALQKEHEACVIKDLSLQVCGFSHNSLPIVSSPLSFLTNVSHCLQLWKSMNYHKYVLDLFFKSIHIFVFVFVQWPHWLVCIIVLHLICYVQMMSLYVTWLNRQAHKKEAFACLTFYKIRPIVNNIIDFFY